MITRENIGIIYSRNFCLASKRCFLQLQKKVIGCSLVYFFSAGVFLCTPNVRRRDNAEAELGQHFLDEIAAFITQNVEQVQRWPGADSEWGVRIGNPKLEAGVQFTVRNVEKVRRQWEFIIQDVEQVGRRRIPNQKRNLN